MIAGVSTGDLYIYEDRECINSISAAHAGAVLCLQEVRRRYELTKFRPYFTAHRGVSNVNFWSLAVWINALRSGIKVCSP